MKKLLKIFISMPFMGICLALYAIAMAVATFVENDYGAPVAKFIVYNAWWFELLQLILAINFIANIFKYKLYKKAKLSILVFHIAFVVILLGAGITRYIGFEGTMSIREGESSNTFLSEKNYLQISGIEEEIKMIYEKQLFISPYLKNSFSADFDVNGKNYDIVLNRVIPNAEKKFIASPDGHPFVEIVFAGKNGMMNYYIEDPGAVNYKEQVFCLNTPATDSSVLFKIENKQLLIQSPYDVLVVPMMGGKDTTLIAGEHPIQPSQLYMINDIKFVVKDFSEQAKLSYVTGAVENGINYNVLEFEVSSQSESKLVYLPVWNGAQGEKVLAKMKDTDFYISYGSKELHLPFDLKLVDFQLERYPGSESPSSFASEVTLIDKEDNINFDYRIYMNNILEHKGYRFYQSSFDKDEKGTVLSVNHDKAGTVVTYIGYLLLALGMFWSIFNKNTYFSELLKRTTEIRKQRLTMMLVFFALLFGQSVSAQENGIKNIDEEHAEHFGSLLTQDLDGRIKPFNTLSSEMLRKVARKEKFDGLNPNQVMLGMMFNPMYWQDAKMIKITHPELQKILNVDEKYVSYNQLADNKKGIYKLKKYVNEAFAKRPAMQDKFDKEIIKVDERMNLCYQVYSGQFLKVFPVPGDIHHHWLSPAQVKIMQDSTHRYFAATVFADYFDAIIAAQSSGNWEKADEILAKIGEFQQTHAKEILPSESKINLEIQYVNSNIFKKIYRYYGLVGFILLVVLFVEILRPKTKVKIPVIISGVLLGLLFIYHTYGLGLRWYISGHAPWSNGYESMIYIAWATMLAGFIFMRRSPISLAATSLLASITLMVAHLSWMDPEITNLVPVLKSYWLTIHVSVITASYGFFAMGALLGILALVLMIFKTGNNAKRIELTISELTNVNHIAIIVGLYLMTIGTFLGGVWANESWGRYWGWDPKETWALITIIFYTFVTHMRFIPGLNNKYAFNLASIIGLFVVLMTYFGVNYYLAGLHSYAQGDPVPVPSFVYYAVEGVVLLAIVANIRNRVKAKE